MQFFFPSTKSFVKNKEILTDKRDMLLIKSTKEIKKAFFSEKGLKIVRFKINLWI